MNDLIDQPAPVRQGEALDLDQLEPYLRGELGTQGGSFTVEQFPGGHSNLTYLVHVGNREIVLRRPPFGSTVKSAHDMSREYTVLSHIYQAYPPAPRPILFCDDESVIGAPFYAMERRTGIILRVDKPPGLHLTPDLVRRTCESVAHNLAALHDVDWRAAGLEALQKPGWFVERQVLGWIRRYDAAKTDEVEHIDEVFEWCKANMPPDSGAVIIHNDYKFDNLVLDPDDISKVVGVLDWEMSTIGDPLFDLGVTLGYWIDPGEPRGISTSQTFVTREPGCITRKEFADIYAERTGYDLSTIHFHFTFAIAKLAVVLQQIYYRYKHGITTDERFAGLMEGVRLLAMRAALSIDRGTI